MTKELYRERIANGLCGTCGKPNNNGHSCCEDCLAEKRLYSSKRYYERQEKYKCGHCGKALPLDYYYILCERCREQQKEYDKKRK